MGKEGTKHSVANTVDYRPSVWERSRGELGSVAAMPHTNTDTPHEDHSNGNQQDNRQTDCDTHNVCSSKKRLTTAGLQTWSNKVGERW